MSTLIATSRPEPLVLRPVDLSHPARAQRRQDLVGAQAHPLPDGPRPGALRQRKRRHALDRRRFEKARGRRLEGREKRLDFRPQLRIASAFIFEYAARDPASRSVAARKTSCARRHRSGVTLLRPWIDRRRSEVLHHPHVGSPSRTPRSPGNGHRGEGRPASQWLTGCCHRTLALP